MIYKQLLDTDSFLEDIPSLRLNLRKDLAPEFLITIDKLNELYERFKGTDWRIPEKAKKTAPKLSAETRKNATHARKVFSGYYTKGLAMSADGATVVVDTLVGVARATTERAMAYAQAGTGKTA